jgi:hypothetical protein
MVMAVWGAHIVGLVTGSSGAGLAAGTRDAGFALSGILVPTRSIGAAGNDITESFALTGSVNNEASGQGSGALCGEELSGLLVR